MKNTYELIGVRCKVWMMDRANLIQLPTTTNSLELIQHLLTLEMCIPKVVKQFSHTTPMAENCWGSKHLKLQLHQFAVCHIEWFSNIIPFTNSHH
jgi:hypothetical protein